MRNIQIEEIKTPLTAFDAYKLFHNEKYSFILDSAMDPQRLGRFSFIGLDPFITIESKNNKITINQNNLIKTVYGNPFNVLKELLSEYKIENNTGLPFVGGAVGFFSYDLLHHLERITKTTTDDIDLPDMVIGFYDTILIYDHLINKTYISSVSFPDVIRNNPSKIHELKESIQRGVVCDTRFLDTPYLKNKVKLKSNFTFSNYCRAIIRARDYIDCGDIYQMNMTQRFTTKINRHPINIYSYLRTINPAPFASYLNYGDMKILSSSPERFLKLQNGYVETRPIKGTMPRGVGDEDTLNLNLLSNSIKDKAENIMIVDLMRNDLGRVCKFGSIKVPELFNIEKYATVFQMVSTVTGELKDECDAVDCIMATFPGGSVTGAPKIRAMEIIDELEPNCRNIYTGSIGYLGFDGDMDLNIVIRTILVKNNIAYYQVGGGIVWDSTPEKEYQETLDKGFALKRALLFH